MPVHGTIDLAYERGGRWHIIDFKTDDVAGRSLAEVAAPYLPQLALYAGALRQATGSPPDDELLFLRTGDLFQPATIELESAVADTRARVDEGALLDEEATPGATANAG